MEVKFSVKNIPEKKELPIGRVFVDLILKKHL